MKLDLINNIISKTKESGVIQNFVKELEKYMKENTLKVESKEENILDQYRNNFNFSIGNNNKIATERNSILDTYAKNTEELGALNYVSKKEDMNSYRVIKIENRKTSNYIISKDGLPNDIGVNSIFREENGKYKLDKETTQNMNNEISKMIEETINKDTFLVDLTENNGTSFDEPELPEELINKISEGTVLKYSNGKYSYYSENGLEKSDKDWEKDKKTRKENK